MNKRFNIDLWILGPILILILISFIILRSVFPDEIGKHITVSIVSIAVYFILTLINYRSLITTSKIVYFFGLSLLILTFIFGELTRGSVRWIKLGSLTIQTSEIIKPLMIFSFSAFLQKRNLNILLNVFLYTALVAVPVFLVLKQPDLGSALVLIVIGISIAFAAGMSIRIMVSSLIIFALLTPMIFQLLQPYQQDRINAFIDPFSDPLGSGYSVIQSMIAVGSGKLFGRGLGHGTQSQLQFIPERHSDFVFAALAEELGFIGAMIVLASYALLLNYLIKMAREIKDTFGKLITIGVYSMILFQVVVNIGMNIGLLPITGITLPLISSGGSSQLAVMMSLGLAQSVARKRKSPKTIEIH